MNKIKNIIVTSLMPAFLSFLAWVVIGFTQQIDINIILGVSVTIMISVFLAFIVLCWRCPDIRFFENTEPIK